MAYLSMILAKFTVPGLICASLISGCTLIGIPATGEPSPASTAEVGAGEITPPDSTNQSVPPTSVSTQVDQFLASATNQSIPVNQTMTAAMKVQPVPCNLASAGIPLDVTIPDDSRLEPKRSFSKIWRLSNSGSCAWTADYAVVYFSGDDLGANRIQPIISTVETGESVEIAVDMVAPDEPGLYSGFWMLRSDTGELFGIGPNGNSPFWVRIQVMAVTAPAPVETATQAPTSAVLATGKVSLAVGESIDLDSGKMNPTDSADGLLERLTDGQLQWKPLGESRFTIFGLSKPDEIECRLEALSDEPILLSKLEAGTYLCYRTDGNLPGVMQIVKLAAGDSLLEIDFTTWAVP